MCLLITTTRGHIKSDVSHLGFVRCFGRLSKHSIAISWFILKHHYELYIVLCQLPMQQRASITKETCELCIKFDIDKNRGVAEVTSQSNKWAELGECQSRFTLPRVTVPGRIRSKCVATHLVYQRWRKDCITNNCSWIIVNDSNNLNPAANNKKKNMRTHHNYFLRMGNHYLLNMANKLNNYTKQLASINFEKLLRYPPF